MKRRDRLIPGIILLACLCAFSKGSEKCRVEEVETAIFEDHSINDPIMKVNKINGEIEYFVPTKEGKKIEYEKFKVSETDIKLRKSLIGACDYPNIGEILTIHWSCEGTTLTENIGLIDVNNKPPEFNKANYSFTASEFLLEGQSVNPNDLIKVLDKDSWNDNVVSTYQIIEESDDHFELVEKEECDSSTLLETTHFTLKVKDRMNHNKQKEHRFKILAKNKKEAYNGSLLQSTADVVIKVIDEDDLDPVFRDVHYVFELSHTKEEDGVTIQQIGNDNSVKADKDGNMSPLKLITSPRIEAYDQDEGINEIIKYSIPTGQEEIVLKSFEIDENTGELTLKSASPELLLKSQISFSIEAHQQNNNERKAHATVSVKLTTEDVNLPLFTQVVRIPKSLPENSQVHSIQVDRDVEFVISGPQQDKFSIDASGQIMLRGSPKVCEDRCTIIVTAKSKRGDNQLKFIFTLVDREPYMKPLFTKAKHQVEVDGSIKQDSNIFKVETNVEGVEMSLEEEKDFQYFSIDKNSGQVKLTKPLDPTKSSFVIRVKGMTMTDPQETDYTEIEFQVKYRLFKKDQHFVEVSKDKALVYQLEFLKPVDHVTINNKGEYEGIFQIESNGKLTMDSSKVKNNEEYKLEISARKSQPEITDKTTIILYIKEKSQGIPLFKKDQYVVEVPSDTSKGQPVFTVKTNEIKTPIVMEIIEGDSDSFTLDSKSGVITLGSGYDGSKLKYTLKIKGTTENEDGEQSTDTTNIEFQVKYRLFKKDQHFVEVSKDKALVYQFEFLKPVDHVTINNEGEYEGIFQIESNGKLTMDSSKVKNDEEYKLEISALKSQPEITDKTTIIVYIKEKSRDIPLFKKDQYVVEVPSDTSKGQPVFTVKTNEIKTPIVMEVIEGDSDSFTLDPESGVITLGSGYDGSKLKYTLKIKGTTENEDGKQSTDTTNIEFHVIHRLFEKDQYFVQVSENSKLVYQLSLLKSVEDITFGIVNESEIFRVSEDGSITMDPSKVKNGRKYKFTVSAQTSNPSISDRTIVIVDVLGDNLNYTRLFEKDLFVAEIPSLVSEGQSIFTVKAKTGVEMKIIDGDSDSLTLDSDSGVVSVGSGYDDSKSYYTLKLEGTMKNEMGEQKDTTQIDFFVKEDSRVFAKDQLFVEMDKETTDFKLELKLENVDLKIEGEHADKFSVSNDGTITMDPNKVETNQKYPIEVLAETKTTPKLTDKTKVIIYVVQKTQTTDSLFEKELFRVEIPTANDKGLKVFTVRTTKVEVQIQIIGGNGKDYFNVNDKDITLTSPIQPGKVLELFLKGTYNSEKGKITDTTTIEFSVPDELFSQKLIVKAIDSTTKPDKPIIEIDMKLGTSVTITGKDKDYFGIRDKNIYLRKDLDPEKLSYQITLEGETTTYTDKMELVFVIDRRLSPKLFSKDVFVVDIYPNATIGTKVFKIKTNVNNVNFEIIQDEKDMFDIDKDSGEVTLRRDLDDDDTKFHLIIEGVKELAKEKVEIVFLVGRCGADVKFFSKCVYKEAISSDASSPRVIVQLRHDSDIISPVNTKYTIISGNENGYFDINDQGGLVLNNPLNSSLEEKFVLVVTATKIVPKTQGVQAVDIPEVGSDEAVVIISLLSSPRFLHMKPLVLVYEPWKPLSDYVYQLQYTGTSEEEQVIFSIDKDKTEANFDITQNSGLLFPITDVTADESFKTDFTVNMRDSNGWKDSIKIYIFRLKSNQMFVVHSTLKLHELPTETANIEKKLMNQTSNEYKILHFEGSKRDNMSSSVYLAGVENYKRGKGYKPVEYNELQRWNVGELKDVFGPFILEPVESSNSMTENYQLTEKKEVSYTIAIVVLGGAVAIMLTLLLLLFLRRRFLKNHSRKEEDTEQLTKRDSRSELDGSAKPSWMIPLPPSIQESVTDGDTEYLFKRVMEEDNENITKNFFKNIVQEINERKAARMSSATDLPVSSPTNVEDKSIELIEDTNCGNVSSGHPIVESDVSSKTNDLENTLPQPDYPDIDSTDVTDSANNDGSQNVAADTESVNDTDDNKYDQNNQNRKKSVVTFNEELEVITYDNKQ